MKAPALYRTRPVDLPYDIIALIYNPNSTGNAPALAKRLSKRLNKLSSARTELIPTKAAGDGQKIAQELCHRYSMPLIISVSGDGGYHDVINGIMTAISKNEAKQPVCAVEAAGNANDHYAHMRSDDSLFSAIKHHKLKAMELLKVQIRHTDKKNIKTIYAHSYVGLGLTPQAVEELNRQQLNPVKEKVIVAKKMLDYKPIKVAINGQDTEVNNIIAAKIGKMSKIVKIDKNLKEAPSGMFRVLIESEITKTSMIRHLLKAAFRGLQDQSNLVSEFACNALQDMSIQLDGEVYSLKKGDNISISVENKILQTL